MKSGWEVLKAIPSSRNGGLHVRGINHETQDPLWREFAWEIGPESIKDLRYDFSGCEFAPGAIERLALIRRLASK